MHDLGFIQCHGFFVGMGNLFGTADIDMKYNYTSSWGIWGHVPPENVFYNNFLEIKSGGFWQLADCPQVRAIMTIIF